MEEQTLVLLKPDCVARGLVGEILSRFEKVGLKIVGLKLVLANQSYVREHYISHIDKPFYPKLEQFLTQSPIVAIVLQGYQAIAVVRKMVGSTDPFSAQPGTIRADYAHMSKERSQHKNTSIMNLIHASDSVDAANREIGVWFSKNELVENYKTVHEQFM
jgi:nucleoside-diphosphate kinase